MTMYKLAVMITNQQKTVKVPAGTRLLIRRCCHAVLVAEGIQGNVEVSVTFLDNEQIRNLNREYRQKDMPTDVLSFPSGENGVYDIDEETGNTMLGDIALSLERAIEQAETYGHSVRREIGFLTVHSMLHLLGYDHEAGGEEAERMREREKAIMHNLSLPRDESYISGE